MGLPTINITFQTLATSAMIRSEKGVVAMILIDTTESNKGSYVFKGFDTIKESEFTADNYDYLRLVFEGNPNRVIVECVDNVEKYSEALDKLSRKKFNYLTVPAIESGDVTKIKSFITTQRGLGKKYKAVLPNCAADNEAIVNFTTDNITVGEKVYRTNHYCARIAGILAGLPFSRSATYYVLNEIESITEHTDPNADIDAGKLIIINDGVKFKIGRGVTSLTTVNKEKPAEYKKIKIVEAMDLIYDDIKTTFEDEYIGKVNNSYDNKAIFLNAVNSYFRQLQKDEILDPNSEAIADIDESAQKLYLEKKGIDIESLSDQQIREANTGSTVFLKANVKPLDAMEDLEFVIII